MANFDQRDTNSSLGAFQARFSQALISGEDIDANSLFAEPKGAGIEQRIAVYRNNIYFSLIEALADLYPVAKKLVGDEFFNAVGREFVKLHPPKSAAMVNYGSEFPGFIREFEPTSGLHWLHDMTELELMCQASYHAADTQPISTDQIAAMQPEQLLDRRVRIAPSLNLYESSFPVIEIWEANQPETESSPEIDLGKGGDYVVIYRHKYELLMETVPKEEFNFLRSLKNGATLSQALTQSLQFSELQQQNLSEEQNNQAGQFLGRLFKREVIIAIEEASQ